MSLVKRTGTITMTSIGHVCLRIGNINGFCYDFTKENRILYSFVFIQCRHIYDGDDVKLNMFMQGHQ